MIEDRQPLGLGELAQHVRGRPAAHHRHAQVEQHRQRHRSSRTSSASRPLAAARRGSPSRREGPADQVRCSSSSTTRTNDIWGRRLGYCWKMGVPRVIGNPPHFPRKDARDMADLPCATGGSLLVSARSCRGGSSSPPQSPSPGQLRRATSDAELDGAGPPGAPVDPEAAGPQGKDGPAHPPPTERRAAAYVARPKGHARACAPPGPRVVGSQRLGEGRCRPRRRRRCLTLAVDLFDGKVATKPDSEAGEPA